MPVPMPMPATATLAAQRSFGMLCEVNRSDDVVRRREQLDRHLPY